MQRVNTTPLGIVEINTAQRFEERLAMNIGRKVKVGKCHHLIRNTNTHDMKVDRDREVKYFD